MPPLLLLVVCYTRDCSLGAHPLSLLLGLLRPGVPHVPVQVRPVSPKVLPVTVEIALVSTNVLAVLTEGSLGHRVPEGEDDRCYLFLSRPIKANVHREVLGPGIGSGPRTKQRADTAAPSLTDRASRRRSVC